MDITLEPNTTIKMIFIRSRSPWLNQLHKSKYKLTNSKLEHNKNRSQILNVFFPMFPVLILTSLVSVPNIDSHKIYLFPFFKKCKCSGFNLMLVSKWLVNGFDWNLLNYVVTCNFDHYLIIMKQYQVSLI